MDYLTLLATRSLIFFPHDAPHPLSPTNSHTSPDTTPEPRNNFLHPDPVTLPLQSLAWADTECAHFLLDHILSTALPSYEHGYPLSLSASPGTISMMDKRLIADAEGMVWKEVEKGKQFIRAVGEWFGRGDAGRISDDQLKSIARRCGVYIKIEEERYVVEHGPGQEIRHGIEDKGCSVHTVHEVLA